MFVCWPALVHCIIDVALVSIVSVPFLNNPIVMLCIGQVRSGLTEKVENEKGLDFSFSDPGKLSPPVLQCNDITFGYPSCEILYSGE